MTDSQRLGQNLIGLTGRLNTHLIKWRERERERERERGRESERECVCVCIKRIGLKRQEALSKELPKTIRSNYQLH